MRVLVIGAGAVGGYYGGRLAEKGEDVTFLVRKRRKEQLDRHGLVIKSVNGDARLKVQTLLAGQDAPSFDLILLSVKAYHLEQTLRDLAPYVGEKTTILPLLNGIKHIKLLQERFGSDKILGGLCFIESTLNAQGEVEQYSQAHDLVFGELDGKVSDRVKAIAALFEHAKCHARPSEQISVEMWKKYIFISAMSGMTCLMNSSIGPIFESPCGKETYRGLLDEIISIARHYEPSISPDLSSLILASLESLSPNMKSSMLRDMEKGEPVETDHFHGALLQLAPKDAKLPLLKAVYSALSIYQERQRADRG
ncbi:ketopantoate reductase family protein [Laceyella putida]|uniref:2-dehydropantoate 2-reductase n=1 Tax=Laceyella putida TaxID=110101 RepID=A0ABW2RGP1_9BACL